MFEVTEGEQVTNGAHLKSIFNEYRRQGLITAIDDFGAGYAGLNMLAQFQPHVLKIDMELIRNIDQDPVRQAIVCGIALVCQRLSIDIVAEGIETVAESAYLRSTGIRYQQGYLFARPGPAGSHCPCHRARHRRRRPDRGLCALPCAAQRGRPTTCTARKHGSQRLKSAPIPKRSSFSVFLHGNARFLR